MLVARPSSPAGLEAVCEVFGRLRSGEVKRLPTGEVSVPATGIALVAKAARALTTAGVEVSELGLRRPTLDDVFLTLTGHLAQDAEPAAPAKKGRR